MADDLRHRFIDLLSEPLPCLVCRRTQRCRCARPKDSPSDAERRADLLLAVRDSELESLRERAEKAEVLLREIAYTDPCEFDHHGNCQAHDLGNPCAHGRAQKLLAALYDTTGPDRG